MAELIIIGNGFDKAQGLSTSYYDFIEYINRESKINPEKFVPLFERLRGNQNFDLINRENPIGTNVKNHIKCNNKFFEFVISSSNKNNWCDLESFYFSILHKRELLKTYSVERLNKEFEVLKSYLIEYLSKEQEKFTPMPVYEEYFNKLASLSDVLILNFNYTNTINQYIFPNTQIQTINIHGELNNPSNPIILGYGAYNNERKELLDKNNDEYVKNIKSLRYNEHSNNESLMKFLNQMSDEETEVDVTVHGHSCGLSDKEILKRIFEHETFNQVYIDFYLKENENDFTSKQHNLTRILPSIDGSNNRLMNILKSHRIPQHSDVQEEHDHFLSYIDRRWK